MDELTKMLFDKGHSHFQEMSGGEINATELVAALINQKDNLIEGMNYALEKNRRFIINLTYESCRNLCCKR